MRTLDFTETKNFQDSNGTLVTCYTGYMTVNKAAVKYSTELQPLSKLIYSEIDGLAHRTKYCYVTSEFLAENFNFSRNTVQTCLKELIINKFITTEMVRDSSTGLRRRIIIPTGKADEPMIPPGVSKKRNSGGMTSGLVTGGMTSGLVTGMTSGLVTKEDNGKEDNTTTRKNSKNTKNKQIPPHKREAWVVRNWNDKVASVNGWELAKVNKEIRNGIISRMREHSVKEEWLRIFEISKSYVNIDWNFSLKWVVETRANFEKILNNGFYWYANKSSKKKSPIAPAGPRVVYSERVKEWYEDLISAVKKQRSALGIISPEESDQILKTLTELREYYKDDKNVCEDAKKGRVSWKSFSEGVVYYFAEPHLVPKFEWGWFRFDNYCIKNLIKWLQEHRLSCNFKTGIEIY